MALQAPDVPTDIIPAVPSASAIATAVQQTMNPAASQGQLAEPTKSLYIGNLSCFVSEDQLRHIFSYLGRVAECKVIKDRNTGMSAGYGFVRFEDHR